MVRMSVQAFDQQGEPWGRDQFPARSKVSPFCRAVQTSTGTRKEAGKLHSGKTLCLPCVAEAARIVR